MPIILIILMLFACASCQKISQSPETKYNPKASAYNVQLGLAYLQQGNRQRAKKKLLTALAEAPDSPEANTALAYFYEKTQEIELAERYYVKAIQVDPRLGASLNNYGAFLCGQHKYDEAEQYFLKAVSEQKYINTALAYENAGICALESHQQQKAKYYFKKAVEQNPKLTRSLQELRNLNNR